MHPSSQEQRTPTHIRFSQDEVGGQAHGSTPVAIRMENRLTNGTNTKPTPPSRPYQQQQPRSPGSDFRHPPPTAAPATKTPSLFFKKPPQQPKSIDTQNYLSAVRRAGNPLYTMSPTSPTTTTTITTAAKAYNSRGPGAGAATMTAMVTKGSYCGSKPTTVPRAGKDRDSIRPSVTSPSSHQQKQQQQRRHFAIPPKSPHQPRLSFGTSPSPRKGNAISVTPVNSTSWVGEGRTQGRKAQEEDDENEEEDDDGGVVQVRMPDFMLSSEERGGGVSKDVGSKSTASTTKRAASTTAGSTPTKKQPSLAKDTGAKPTANAITSATKTATGTTLTKQQASIAGWLKNDVKELVNSVAVKSSKSSAKTKDVMDLVESVASSASSASSKGFVKRKVEDEDEDVDENKFGFGWLDETLADAHWNELAKDLDLDERKNGGYLTQEVELDSEIERELKRRAKEHDQECGLEVNETVKDERKVHMEQKVTVEEKKDKRRKRVESSEPDFPYSEDDEPRVQEKEPVPAIKDSVTKSRDHDQERDLERERERKQKHAERNATSPATGLSQERRRSEVKVSRRASFLPSDIESDSDSFQSQRHQSSSDRRGDGTSSSGRATQEQRKHEAKASNALSILHVDLSNDEELSQSQRPQQHTSQQSRKPESRTPLEDILRNQALDKQSDRRSTPTRSLYKYKNSNLHRSIDAPDSDSDLDDSLFSIAATQSQSDPYTPSSSSVSASRPLSQAPSVASADSFSSTIVKTGSPKRERDFGRMPKKSTGFVELDDSSLDEEDPFLEHINSKNKLTTNGNKGKEGSGVFVLKTRKDEPRSYVDTCQNQDQQRDERRRKVQIRRDLDDDNFEESIGRWDHVGGGYRSRPNRLEKMDDNITRYRCTNGSEDTRRSVESGGRTKKRIVCKGEIEESDDDNDTKAARSTAATRSNTSTVPRKDRPAILSFDKESSGKSDERRTTERDYSHSPKDDRGRREDRESISRPRKLSVERSSRVAVAQEQLSDDPFGALLTPTNPQRRTPKADHLLSGQKRRTRLESTSDEDTDSPPSRATTPEPRRTTIMQFFEKPPSTPTRGANGKKTELDGIKIQGLKSPRKSPRIGDDLKLPSPRRKRIRTIAEMISLSDDDHPSPTMAKEGEELCPYCGDVLPTVMSARLKSSLAKVLTRQEDRLQAQQELLKRERMKDEHLDGALEFEIVEIRGPTAEVMTPKKSWVPRPRKPERLRDVSTQSNVTIDNPRSGAAAAAAGSGFFATKEDELHQRLFSKITAVEKFEFCRIHVAEENIVPAGLERNYPLFIRFDELPDRIRRMEPELLGIIRGTVASPYLDRALASYRTLGHGARNPQAVLAGVQMTLPGYYGSKGSSKIVEVLVKMFIETQILTSESARPQVPIEYIQQVLVPETGMRLILEDRRGGIGGDGEGKGELTVEEAQAIMLDSVEFGNYVHDIELPW